MFDSEAKFLFIAVETACHCTVPRDSVFRYRICHQLEMKEPTQLKSHGLISQIQIPLHRLGVCLLLVEL